MPGTRADAGRALVGFDQAVCRQAAQAAVGVDREQMARYAGMRHLEVWYSLTHVPECDQAWVADRHDDPLLLQVKQATASVLEPHAGRSRYRHAGRRVVAGQAAATGSGDAGAPARQGGARRRSSRH